MIEVKILAGLRNSYRNHEGNTKDENNGYVVFKGNIHGSAGKLSGGEGGQVSHFSTECVWSGQRIKDDVHGFSSPRIFASWQRASV